METEIQIENFLRKSLCRWSKKTYGRHYLCV